MVISKRLSSVVLGVGAMLVVACGGGAAPADPTTTTGATGTATPATTAPAAAAPGDSDGDGIMDAADKCPDKKEDGKGAAPADGCPSA